MSQIETRPAVKLLLKSNSRIVLAKGTWDRLNLLGGGIEPDEGQLDTLQRELNEEAGIGFSHLDATPVYLGGFARTIRPHTDADPIIAEWNVWGATLLPSVQLVPCGEIKEIEFFDRNAALRHSLVGDMAKYAIRQFGTLNY